MSNYYVMLLKLVTSSIHYLISDKLLRFVKTNSFNQNIKQLSCLFVLLLWNLVRFPNKRQETAHYQCGQLQNLLHFNSICDHSLISCIHTDSGFSSIQLTMEAVNVASLLFLTLYSMVFSFPRVNSDKLEMRTIFNFMSEEDFTEADINNWWESSDTVR